MEDFKPLGSNELENIEGGSVLLCIAAGVAVVAAVAAIVDAIKD